jgi:hypothetical protein
MDPIDIALRVGHAVEKIGGAYFVGGSLASSLQGEPRATNDIDIVVSLPLGYVSALKNNLGSDFEVDEQMLRIAVLRATSCNIFFLPALTKIDIFGVGGSAYDELEFSRRQSVIVREDGATLFLKSAEDTILRKLWWYRQGAEVSERQWRDVLSVLRVSGPILNQAHMQTWSRFLGVSDLLERALLTVA